MSKETKFFWVKLLGGCVLLYCGIEHFDAVYAALCYFSGLMLPFALGGAIAFVLNVPMRKFEAILFLKSKRMAGVRRPLAWLLSLLCVVGVLLLATLVVVPEVVQTFAALAAQLPSAVDGASEQILLWADRWPVLEQSLSTLSLDWASISAQAITLVQSAAGGLVSGSVGFISSVVSGVTTFAIGFVFSIYLLFQKENLGAQARQVLFALLPQPSAARTVEVAALTSRVFSNFLSGQCLEAILLGAMFVVAMSIFRLPYAMLIGVLIAVTALIPLVGAFIGCAVGAFLIVTVDPVKALVFVVLFLVLQQVEGNLIYPHVVGGSIGLPSIWVLTAVTLGGSLFGILGILLFIPLCSVLYALFREFIKKRLAQKGLSEDARA